MENPSINAYRDFEQWSVYTEYQGFGLGGASLKADFTQKVYRAVSIQLESEALLLKATREQAFLYHFYQLGLKLSLSELLDFKLYFTNKLMNLDVHYQTFYQSESPVLGFSFHRLIGQN